MRAILFATATVTRRATAVNLDSSARHTWASLTIMAGAPLMVVAINLGHRDTRMVEKHYGRLAPSYIADAIRSGAPRFYRTRRPKLKALELR